MNGHSVRLVAEDSNYFRTYLRNDSTQDEDLRRGQQSSASSPDVSSPYLANLGQ